MITPVLDVVTPENAKKNKIIIGIQIGLFGLIFRLGVYK